MKLKFSLILGEFNKALNNPALGSSATEWSVFVVSLGIRCFTLALPLSAKYRRSVKKLRKMRSTNQWWTSIPPWNRDSSSIMAQLAHCEFSCYCSCERFNLSRSPPALDTLKTLAKQRASESWVRKNLFSDKSSHIYQRTQGCYARVVKCFP